MAVSDYLNARNVLILGGSYWVWTSYLGGEVSIPEWSGLLYAGAAVVAVGGYYGAGKIAALLPDDPRIHFIALDSREGAEDVFKGKWSMTPDEWDEWRVGGGQLVEQTSFTKPGRLYFATDVDVDAKTVTATWRKGASPAEFEGFEEVDQVEARIERYRDDLEPRARFGDWLQRNLTGVVRSLDARRGEAINDALTPHTTPSFGDRDDVRDVLRDELPDDVLPAYLAADDDRATDDVDAEPKTRTERVMDVADSLSDLAGAETYVRTDAVADGGENDGA